MWPLMVMPCGDVIAEYCDDDSTSQYMSVIVW